VRSLMEKGNAAARSGDWKRAEKLYGEAIKVQPRLSEAYYNRGVARLKLGDNEGAAKDIRITIQLDKSFIPAYVNLGAAYLASGDWPPRSSSLTPWRGAIRTIWM
jgi:tetratricopeptide (TPR) repeat protein